MPEKMHRVPCRLALLTALLVAPFLHAEEAVKAMAQKAREENELLKSRIAALEAKGKGKKGE